jgi:hypothetical protein
MDLTRRGWMLSTAASLMSLGCSGGRRGAALPEGEGDAFARFPGKVALRVINDRPPCLETPRHYEVCSRLDAILYACQPRLVNGYLVPSHPNTSIRLHPQPPILCRPTRAPIAQAPANGPPGFTPRLRGDPAPCADPAWPGP